MEREAASTWDTLKETARREEDRNGAKWGALLAYQQFKRNGSTGNNGQTRAPVPTSRQNQKAQARKFQWEIPVLVDPLGEDVYPDDYSHRNSIHNVDPSPQRYVERRGHESNSSWRSEGELDGYPWKSCDENFNYGDQGFPHQGNSLYHHWQSSPWLKRSSLGETSTSAWKGQPSAADYGFREGEWRREETGRSCSPKGVMERKVEKIVAGIWEKVEREMGCQSHTTGPLSQERWHQDEKLGQPHGCNKICNAGEEQGRSGGAGMEIERAGEALKQRDLAKGSTIADSQHQILLAADNGPPRIVRAKERAPLKEMIDWVSKHEYQLEPAARRKQPRAWEDLSFADRTVASHSFKVWRSTTEHTVLRETAAEKYAGQQRRIRCFRIWLLVLISSKEEAQRRQAAEHASRLHRLKIADEFHRVFHLHRYIRAWRSQAEEEHTIRQKVARCRAEADQEILQTVIAEKFRGCYLLNKTLKGWRRACKDRKEEHRNRMDGSALHEKIKKAIQIVNDRQHIAAPVDCDKERTTHSDPQPENKAQGPAEEKVSDDCSRSEISKHEACQPPSDEHSSQIKNGGPPLLALEEDPCVCKPSQATTDEPLEERAEDAREPLKSLNNLTDIKVEDQKLVVCEEGHSFDISQDVKLKIDVAGGAKKGKGGGGGGGGTHPSLLPSVESGGSTCNPPPSRSQGLASASHAALVLGRELASRQAALARMHCARSTVSRFGWNPWRQVLEMGRRRTCLAEGHRRLKLLKATVVNWRLVLLPGRWEEVIREVGNVGRARVHHQVSKLCTSFGGWYALSRALAFRSFSLKRKCLRVLESVTATSRKAQIVACQYFSHHIQQQCLRCWSSYVQEEVSERIVLELQREARVRLAMDSRKKSVCLKSWHLLSSAARLERAREENKNTAWNQVRGWIDDFRQERQKTSPISMEISFHLEDSDEDEKTDALEFF